MTVGQLLALNAIRDPNRIYPGQRLRISATSPASGPSAAKPKRVIHIVQAGENLTRIARRYGTSICAIVAANGIANPSYLRVGQRLMIPVKATTHKPPAKPPVKAAAKPATPIVHIVQAGEHLTGIARRYGTSIGAIVAANGIANPSYLRVGQRLVIPGSHVVARASAKAMPLGMAATVAARAQVRAIITAEARSQGVPRAFALAVAWQESGWQPRAVSSAGALGVMQLTPATADWVATTMLGHRVHLFDARSNVQAGVRLLRHYFDRYHGNKALVLAAYYQGQTAADRHGIYRISRPYIASILALESLFSP
jgi:LysM repeat protein